MKTRVHAVEVTINQDLTVSYRLTLPISERHIHLFQDRENIKSYIRKNKIMYHYVIESADRLHILERMTVAQLIVSSEKIIEIVSRRDYLFNYLNDIHLQSIN